MIGTQTDYLALIEAMPAGTVTILSGVDWEEYEEALRQVDEQTHVRLSYDDGRLEIMTLSLEHEGMAGFFPVLIFVLAQECNLHYVSLRSTTMRKRRKSKGTEPDDCYYFGNLPQIVGKGEFDPEVDPPPDLALEVDLTSPSLKKFPIYAALGVPEIWRIKNNRISFHQLQGKHYVETSHSDRFPFLTPNVLFHYLQRGLRAGNIVMAQEFKEWIKANKPADNPSGA